MAQGSQPIGSPHEGVELVQNWGSDDPPERPREEKGRLSNPPQRRLSPATVDDIVEAYRAGATINQLAAEFGIHRTTVTGHLDRHRVPRHSKQTAWDDDILKQAAELYATGLSLAAIAHRFGVDPQTVATRFRRAAIPVRLGRGSRSHHPLH